MTNAWYPCCCPPPGSTVGSSELPGSTLPGSSVFGEIGSSGVVECECCTGGVAPLQIQVEALGVVQGTEQACDECGDLNGTYILTWLPPAEYGNFCLPPDALCAWGLVFDTVCGRNKAQLFLRCETDFSPNVFVGFSIEPVDCLDPINGGLNWWKSFSGVGQLDCFFDGLTLTAPPGGPAASCALAAGTKATLYAV